MSEKRICKYCGMELSEDIPHGLRECHLHAVARIAELEGLVDQLIEAGESMSLAVECENQIEANAYYSWKELVKDWKEREE